MFLRSAQLGQQLARHPLLHVGVAIAKRHARSQFEGGANTLLQTDQGGLHAWRQFARAQRQRGGLVFKRVDERTLRSGQTVVQR